METHLTQATAALDLPNHSKTTAVPSLPGLAAYHRLLHYLQRGNNRWGMQTFMLAVQGNILAPATLLIIQYYDFGYQDYFAALLAVLFLAVLVTNLAQLPVRLILNLFLLNIAIHAAIIAGHFLR